MTHTHSSDTAAHGISFFLVGSVNAGTFTLHGVLGLMVSVVGRAGEVARARALAHADGTAVQQASGWSRRNDLGGRVGAKSERVVQRVEGSISTPPDGISVVVTSRI